MHTNDLGDHIGMESCVDLEGDIQPFNSSSKVAMIKNNRKPCETSNQYRRTSRKELPPPLPIQNSTMMKRYYTNDKRLVITQEKIETPKFHFMAHRSHGRLTLQLVNNNDDEDTHIINELSSSDDDHENVVNNNNIVNINEVSRSDDDRENNVVIDEVADCGGCYRYNAAVRVVANGPCLFVNQNQLHAIRPLHI